LIKVKPDILPRNASHAASSKIVEKKKFLKQILLKTKRRGVQR